MSGNCSCWYFNHLRASPPQPPTTSFEAGELQISTLGCHRVSGFGVCPADFVFLSLKLSPGASPGGRGDGTH